MASRCVLVTDVRLASSTAMVRSLGRAGHRVVVASSVPGAAGLRSRYVWRSVTLPGPDDPGAVVARLREAVVDHGVELVIPVTDAVLMPLLAARRDFAGLCELALPPSEAVEVSHDKLNTVRLAEKLGIPVPATVEYDEVAGDLAGAGEQLGWPVVVKPRHAHRIACERGALSGVAYAPDAHLLRQLGELGAGPLLLQSFFAGEGQAVGAVADRGRLVAAFQYRRIREFPLTGGPGSCRTGLDLDPHLCRWSEQLIEALAWTGLIMIEFRVGRGGTRLMEINGRTWGSLPLAVKSGVDFPLHVLDVHLGGSSNGVRPALPSYVAGRLSRNLELELRWAFAVLRQPRLDHHPIAPRRAALAVLARAAWPLAGYDMACRDDPGPALAEVRRVAQVLTAESWRRRPRVTGSRWSSTRR